MNRRKFLVLIPATIVAGGAAIVLNRDTIVADSELSKKFYMSKDQVDRMSNSCAPKDVAWGLAPSKDEMHL